jgi:hypothetical protein
MIVTVAGTAGARINMRAEPSQNAVVTATYVNGEELAAIGRNAAGDWILARDGRRSGWFSTLVARVNGDVALLPVIE